MYPKWTVYALYNYNKRIALLMGIFVLNESLVLYATVIQDTSEMYFTPHCLTVLKPRLIITYSCVIPACIALYIYIHRDVDILFHSPFTVEWPWSQIMR